jgi:1-acyl-sn-glycerol-3-phosphate acyltransferase
MEPMYDINIKTASRVLGFLNPRRLYHRAEIEFAERLPQSGGAVIVSNHGRLDFDSFILSGLILRSCKRLPRLMADHLWFRLPFASRIMSLAGAVDGTRENATYLLGRREMVLTYPGGVREIIGSRFGHEDIDWRGRTGFANVAIAAGVPIIPVVGIGVNNGFIFLSSGRLLGKLLFHNILNLGSAYDGYRNPLVMGLLLLPLPFSMAVHFPLPCKVRYFVGEPIYPPSDNSQDGEGQNAENELACRVADSMRRLFEQFGRATQGT